MILRDTSQPHARKTGISWFKVSKFSSNYSALFSKNKKRFVAATTLVGSFVLATFAYAFTSQNSGTSANAQTDTHTETHVESINEQNVESSIATPPEDTEKINTNSSTSVSVNGETHNIRGGGSVHKTYNSGSNTSTVDIKLESTGTSSNSMTIINNSTSVNSNSSSTHSTVVTTNQGVIVQ